MHITLLVMVLLIGVVESTTTTQLQFSSNVNIQYLSLNNTAINDNASIVYSKVFAQTYPTITMNIPLNTYTSPITVIYGGPDKNNNFYLGTVSVDITNAVVGSPVALMGNSANIYCFGIGTNKTECDARDSGNNNIFVLSTYITFI